MRVLLLELILLLVTFHPNSIKCDVVGKLTVGYHGWFNAKGDGAPPDKWMRWSDSTIPTPNNTNIEIYPDVREYKNTYPAGFGKLGNGQPATLFSSWDAETVNLHFKWMRENEIDGAALHRTGYDAMSSGATRLLYNGVIERVMAAAEQNNRTFYLVWNTTNWENFYLQLFADLEYNLRPLKIFNSTAYARQNGKLVIGIWGIGFVNHPGEPAPCHALVERLKDMGFYVIGGVPAYWRSESNDSKKSFRAAYLALDMVQPWLVNGFGTLEEVKNYTINLRADINMLKRFNVEYQPVVFPGFSNSNLRREQTPRNQIPRLHGDFMWQQFFNIRTVGIKSAFVAMFDDFDEGTAIAKAAEDKTMIPSDQYFLTLDADGIHVSSDFYLRLTADGNRMLKEQIPLTPEHPTKHVP